MPIHDWTRVDAGTFHDFHLSLIVETKRALNRGLLPPEYYAMAEQIAGGLGPDVLTLQRPLRGAPTNGNGTRSDPTAGVAVTTTPPRVDFHLRTEADQYAAKAKALVIRHKSDHKVVAVVEFVSPGNKNNRHGILAFVGKAVELLRGGVHLLVIDLFPTGPRDPQGVHKLIWDEFTDSEFVLPAERRLTLAAYIGGRDPEAFVQLTAVGLPLTEMPLFLEPDIYVPVPLESIYQAAWADVPPVWRDVLTASTNS